MTQDERRLARYNELVTFVTSNWDKLSVWL